MKRALTCVGLALMVPLVVLWAWWQERRILSRGWGLSELERSWAKAAGVAEPATIRVMTVDTVPLPMPVSWAEFFHERFGLGIGSPIGMSLRYGIYLAEDHMPNPRVLVHEFVHTAQYERLGLFKFMWLYFCQCAFEGYNGAPLECEANEVAARVLERLPRV